jgi:Tol biopolymer transport system component
MDLQTGERSRVPLDADVCCPISPVWSPDGRWIALSGASPVTGRRDIMVVRAQGGDVRRVIRHPGVEPYLDWSPNGRRISFTRGTSWNGKTSILSVRLDGTGLRELVNTPALDLKAAWSPRGARLAFYSDGPHPYGSSPQPGLWISGAQGQDPHVVLRDRTIAYVDW